MNAFLPFHFCLNDYSTYSQYCCCYYVLLHYLFFGTPFGTSYTVTVSGFGSHATRSIWRQQSERTLGIAVWCLADDGLALETYCNTEIQEEGQRKENAGSGSSHCGAGVLKQGVGAAYKVTAWGL